MKNINLQAPVKCSKSIAINANKETVWNILTDINKWSSWQSEIAHSKLNGSLQPNTSFDWKTGGANIHSTLHTVYPNSEFGWTGKTFGMYAIHNWTLREQNGVTEVIVDESMEGFVASLFKKAFNKSLAKGMEKWLELLKTECERGK